MAADTIFSASSLLVMPFWFLMLFLPYWRTTQRTMGSPLVALAPALVYLALVVPRFGEVFSAVLRPTLSGIAALLSSEAGAILAWAHFLAFDLLVGRGIYLDSQKRELSPWLVTPILFLTLMLGPVGYLLYLAVRGLDVSRLRAWLGNSWRTDRPLTLLTLGMLGLLAACVAGIALDSRVIGGAPAWLKPAKFAVSIAAYSLTLVWLLRFVEGRERLKRAISGITVACFLVEIVVIAVQAARGTTSHFNVATPLDAALWTAMGAAIQPVWVLCALIAFLLIRQRGLDPALGAAVRGGAAIAVVGMLLAFFMTSPTAAQRAGFGSHPATGVGAHSVGVPHGGPGLPVVGWSTEGGDLRVAHFIGLHGLQALPLLAWGIGRLARRRTWLTERHRAALVRTGGAAYLGVTLLAAWQALRGQSVAAPDALTVGALVALFSVSLAVSGAILLAAAWGDRRCVSRSTPGNALAK